MSLNTAIHKSQLIRILKEVYSNPKMGPLLGFKGGTAAFLFYDLDRFSVDLDFDLLDASKNELVFHEMHGILEKFGHFGGHTPSKKLTWAGSTHHELLPRKGVRIINFYL